MVRLAFTQYPAPPRPDAPNDVAAQALNDIEDADYKYEARLAQLDLLTAFASPERFPNKRKGVFNTVDLSTTGRAWIVDNDTLEGDPAPNAELARELPNQTLEERCARYNLRLKTDSPAAAPAAWRAAAWGRARDEPAAARGRPPGGGRQPCGRRSVRVAAPPRRLKHWGGRDGTSDRDLED